MDITMGGRVCQAMVEALLHDARQQAGGGRFAAVAAHPSLGAGRGRSANLTLSFSTRPATKRGRGEPPCRRKAATLLREADGQAPGCAAEL